MNEGAALIHVFFDVGGVLGSNGWDREQRARAIAEFELDDEFEPRHAELAGEWETGRLTLDEYLDSTVFYAPRPFTRAAFVAFMQSQSVPDEACLAVVRRLAATGRVRLFTLNNESEALNVYRIAAFGLRGMFDGFLSSCWLGVRKPSHLIFQRALHIVQAEPARVLFVDDRAQNLRPAQLLGMRTHHFVEARALEAALASYDLITEEGNAQL